MAVIHEKLVLEDKFTQTLTQFIRLAEQSSGTAKEMNAAARSAGAQARVLSSAYRVAAASSAAAAAEQRRLTAEHRANAAASNAAVAAARAQAAQSRAATAALQQEAAAQNANIAAYSTDGINWTSHLVDGDGTDVTAQVRAALDMDAVDVSVPDDTAAALDIPAGSTVNDALLAAGQPLRSVYDLIVGAGVIFFPSTMPVSANWRDVTYGDGKFVAVADGPSTVASYSTDGINWTQTTLPSNKRWSSVTYGGGKFVAVARNTNIAACSSSYNPLNEVLVTLYNRIVALES